MPPADPGSMILRSGNILSRHRQNRQSATPSSTSDRSSSMPEILCSTNFNPEWTGKSGQCQLKEQEVAEPRRDLGQALALADETGLTPEPEKLGDKAISSKFSEIWYLNNLKVSKKSSILSWDLGNHWCTLIIWFLWGFLVHACRPCLTSPDSWIPCMRRWCKSMVWAESWS